MDKKDQEYIKKRRERDKQAVQRLINQKRKSLEHDCEILGGHVWEDYDAHRMCIACQKIEIA